MPKENLMLSVETSKDLTEAREKFVSALKMLREELPDIKVCYVIGTVTSDGPENIEKNLALLKERSRKVGENFKGVAFSAADLFNSVLFERFDSSGAKNQDYLDFWEAIIKSGYITDITRTPRWQKSMGASYENHWATEMGLKIHDYWLQACLRLTFYNSL